MKIENVYDLDESQVYYVYDLDLQDYLYNQKKINYISKGIDKQGKKYFVYFKSILLLNTLDERGCKSGN